MAGYYALAHAHGAAAMAAADQPADPHQVIGWLICFYFLLYFAWAFGFFDD